MADTSVDTQSVPPTSGSSTGGGISGFFGSFLPIVIEDDAFYNKWAGVLLIGPIIPAFLSVIIIIVGQNISVNYSGSCGYPLESFVNAAVAVCYLFLLVYSWIFLGHNISVTIDKERIILSPFKSLKTIRWVFLALGILSAIVWIVGTGLLNLSVFCAATSPGLYQVTSFILGIYWISFVIIVSMSLKLLIGDKLSDVLKEQLKGPTMKDIEMELFKKKFGELDVEKNGSITVDVFPNLLQNVGVYVPPEEVTGLQKTLDPKDTGLISYAVALEWFKKLNAAMDAKGITGDDASDDDDDDVKSKKK